MKDLSSLGAPSEYISECQGAAGEKNPAPGRESEPSLGFCLCINGSPRYSFGDLATAKKFQKKLMESREKALQKYNYPIRLEKGLENEGSLILGIHWVLGVIPVFRTLEKLEIFETVQVQ